MEHQGRTAPDAGQIPVLAVDTRRLATEVLARVRSTAQVSFKDGAHVLTFQALGTRCLASFSAPTQQRDKLAATVLEWVAGFEARYSRFLPGSWISTLNREAGRSAVTVDAEAATLLDLFQHAQFVSRGTLDPTALPLLNLWNWKAQPPVIPTRETVQDTLKRVGWRRVVRGPGRLFLPQVGMGLDFGGLGKEFAVDTAAELLARNGAQSILVDFGADVRTLGMPADGRQGWHIGLDDPRKPGQCWCGLGIRGGGVATSGDYIRRFELNGRRYGHILDIRTGDPVDNGCRGVSVVAPTCTLAGLLTTAAFVLGPEEGLRLIESHAAAGAAGAIITEHGVLASRRFYEHVVSGNAG